MREMNLDQLQRVFDVVGVTPCIKFACSERERCKSELLACSSFANYIETGRAAHPFIEISHGAGKRIRKEQMMNSARPTRAQYLAIYHEDAA